MKPQVSIIIPIYKVEQYLEKCIESIIAGQQEANSAIEVILVDDGSPDRSGEIADKFASQYSYIQVIHKQNAGVAAARNTGIDIAQGEWLYFVDSDDWLAEGAVRIMNDISQKHSDTDVIIFDAYKDNGEQVQAWEHFDREQVWTSREELFSLQRGMLYYPASFPDMKVPLAAPWDKLYKRSFIVEKQLRFCDKLKVLDDMIFNMEVFGRALKVAYCKEKIYHYRYVEDSITNSYKADRVEKDCAVWNYVKDYIDKEKRGWSIKEQNAFLQSFYCRIIKSFSICCRLCFFHSQNPKSSQERLIYVRQVLEQQPYAEAFHKVDLKNAEWKLKVMIILGRMKCIWGIKLLHVGQELIKNF